MRKFTPAPPPKISDRLIEKLRRAQQRQQSVTADQDAEEVEQGVQRPSLVTKAKHAAQAGARIARAAAKGEPIKASAEERDRRLAICRACKFWDEGGNVGLGECQHPGCGCTRFKHGLITETCPLGKWEQGRGAR